MEIFRIYQVSAINGNKKLQVKSIKEANFLVLN